MPPGERQPRPAPLLSKRVVAHAQAVGAAIRERRAAPLVGAGISRRRGLPGWAELIRRLILAWREADHPRVRDLPDDVYVSMTRAALLDDDLMVASYLRRMVARRRDWSFGGLLYSAFYRHPSVALELFTPTPDHVHRHLVATFAQHPSRLWTTNYDDLLEEAAGLAGIPHRTLDPDRRATASELTVAHLHGFIAPFARQGNHPDPDRARVVLAEDDFHAVEADLVGWTSREFHRLFDEHSVLMLGLSLDDPNLRRALTFAEDRHDSGHRHFAVLTRLGIQTSQASATSSVPDRRRVDPNAVRRKYWNDRRVTIVEIPGHDFLLPFIVRIRYEGEGQRPGDLWRSGAERGYLAINPWQTQQQSIGRDWLDTLADVMSANLGIPREEIVEVGIFLVRPDACTLELVFRGGGPAHAVEGQRIFSIEPDAPTGLAGRVFTSGDVVRVRRTHPLHDFQLQPNGDGSAEARYAGIICAPIVDWEEGGIPLGVVYVTTSRTDGVLFNLDTGVAPPPGSLALDEVTDTLSGAALTLLKGELRPH